MPHCERRDSCPHDDSMNGISNANDDEAGAEGLAASVCVVRAVCLHLVLIAITVGAIVLAWLEQVRDG